MAEHVPDQASLPVPMSMVCMSVVEDGNKIAFCSYDEEKNTIFIEETVSSNVVQVTVEQILAMVRPSLMLLPNKIVNNESLFENLTTAPIVAGEVDGHVEPTDGDGAPPSQPSSIKYHLMKNACYETKTCKDLILRLQVQSLSRNTSPRSVRDSEPSRTFPLQTAAASFRISNYHALASVVDFESKLQVQALGALLSFLESTIFRLHESGNIVVHDVLPMQSSLFMKITPDTLSALGIFATEHHPLQATQGRGKSKEGFSLFSLLDRTHSRVGRARLRDWLLQPLMDVEHIGHRQNGVELFMDLREAAATLCELLSNVGPVQAILTRIQKCCTQARDFAVLIKSLQAAIAIFNTLHHDIVAVVRQAWQNSDGHVALDTHDPYLTFVAMTMEQCQVGVLQHLLEHIVNVVDEDATVKSSRVAVRKGYHPPLDDWKEQYEMLESTMQSMCETLGFQYPHLKNFLCVIFMPQLGFLIALKHDPLWEQTDDALPADFVFVCTEDDTSYFKETQTQNLDDAVGDIDSYIKDTEKLIVSGLEEAILDEEMHLRNTFSALADLDCILSFANVALDHKYVRPVVVSPQEQCIRIRNGKHPLQDIILPTEFVANDVNIDSQDRLNLVTGPNFSGKSCYARQVGVLVYMAQIGSFLPCEAAQISVSDQILARFSTTETCAIPQSSFQLDLTHMGTILRRATSHSLVIVDEFGKGTSPESGVALLLASIQALAKIGAKVVYTTHFLEIFTMKLLKDGADGVRALRMAVQLPDDQNSEAVPLFRLERSVASSSAGLACAKLAGVKEAILVRAHEIVNATQQRHRVRPLTEILRGIVATSPTMMKRIPEFLSEDWSHVHDDVVQEFVVDVCQE